MTAVEELVLVIQLACMTEDRTKAEQRALVNVARRVDKERNHYGFTNPRLDGVPWCSEVEPPPCTYQDDHQSKPRCKCSGTGRSWEPKGGWSRLEDHAKGVEE